MKIPIFLSKPRPMDCCQKRFVDYLIYFLKKEGLEPRTLGVTDYTTSAPLKGIRRIMMESDGLLAVALRRTYIKKGFEKKDNRKIALNKHWLTSPYCQIEPAMAFQLGLPVLILREEGVRDEGILEKGVIGEFMSEFKIKDASYFESTEFTTLLREWEAKVRTVAQNKGNPPKLY